MQQLLGELDPELQRLQKQNMLFIPPEVLEQVSELRRIAQFSQADDIEQLRLTMNGEEQDTTNEAKNFLAEELRRMCCERVALERECVKAEEDSEEQSEVAQGSTEDFEVGVLRVC